MYTHLLDKKKHLTNVYIWEEKGDYSDDNTTLEQNTSINNPHDKAFKLLFKDTKIAQDVIKVNLPENLVARIDFSTMDLIDSSFVSREMRETFSDVLFRVRYGEWDLHVCFFT